MSDLNDDLLNYELGEELDDTTVPAANEDELLLSDEELEKDVSCEQRAVLKDEAEKWVITKLKTKTNDKEDTKKPDDIVTTTSSCNKASPVTPSRNGNFQADSNVSTSEELPPKTLQEGMLRKTPDSDQQSKNDEVTSTNKEIEDQLLLQTSRKFEHSKHHKLKDELIRSSQENSCTTEADEMFSDCKEETEERGERKNIKQTNERDTQVDPSEKHHGKFYPFKRGRGGIIIHGRRYRGPRIPVRYPHTHHSHHISRPNENFNSQSQYSYQEIDIPLRSYPIVNQMPFRMEVRPPIGSSYRQQNPNEFMYCGPKNDYINQSNNAYYGSSAQVCPVFRHDTGIPLAPQGHIRHKIPLPSRTTTIPSQGQTQTYTGRLAAGQNHPTSNTNHSGNLTILANVQIPEHSVTQSVIPRKVLINPNFKGGVEAATSQLMKDTQFMQVISSQAIHLQNDEELLRQQEEFIKRNRMHIEERRYKRSPSRSRSRERSYSPIKRDRRESSRERRGCSPRKRARRASSRGSEDRFSKIRRSNSFERRRRDKFEEEDEETRAYRQEIEKQKAMREKVLRDKEMRRRKAAEGKQIDEQIPADLPQKFTPIIVTESKIISLKKKPTTELAQITTKPINQQQQTIQRTIPTAKILPGTKCSKTEQSQQQNIVKDASTVTLNPTAMAIIKPVIKKTISVQADISTNMNDIDGDESFDEELLLADTATPFLSSPRCHTIPKNTGISLISTPSGAFSSSNRRVVLKSSISKSDKDKNTDINRKPIFDRLEKKISVNESVKKKIQRIVIKNVE